MTSKHILRQIGAGNCLSNQSEIPQFQKEIFFLFSLLSQLLHFYVLLGNLSNTKTFINFINNGHISVKSAFI